MMSALLALFGCRDDDSVNGDDGGIIFNAVAIDNVSEPSEDGLVTIALTFRDEGGNELKMAAGGLYSYLDPGYYNLAPAVAGRFDAVFELTVGGSPVALDEGAAYVTRENNYYDIAFEFKAGEKVYSGTFRKSVAFKSDYHKTLSSGGTGTVKRDQYVSSSYLGQSIKYTIYLPKGYDGTKEYPILYILHGAWSHNNEWFDRAALNAYASEYAAQGGPDMIIVSPHCINDCFYCNGYVPGLNYMSFFFEEFVPYIESAYSVRSERNSRAVAGLSMGGYGSLYYGLLHPEMFCHVYACSAAIGMGPSAPDLHQFITGAVQSGEVGGLPGLTLEMGSGDATVPPSSNAQFVKFLKENKVPCEYITRAGGHDWVFWNACAPKIIAKVGAVFAHNN